MCSGTVSWGENNKIYQLCDREGKADAKFRREADFGVRWSQFAKQGRHGANEAQVQRSDQGFLFISYLFVAALVE